MKGIYFCYDVDDLERAMIVKFSISNNSCHGFYDKADLLKIMRKSDDDLEDFLNIELKNMRALVILVGENAKGNHYINKIIDKCILLDMDIIEINICDINPFGKGTSTFKGWVFDSTVLKYSWCEEKGYKYINQWIGLQSNG